MLLPNINHRSPISPFFGKLNTDPNQWQQQMQRGKEELNQSDLENTAVELVALFQPIQIREEQIVLFSAGTAISD